MTQTFGSLFSGGGGVDIGAKAAGDMSKSNASHSSVGKTEGKTCASCNQWRAFGDYNVDKSRTDGFNPYCKLCRKAKRAAGSAAYNEKRRALYAENSVPLLERNKSWRDDNKDSLNARRREARSREAEKYKKKSKDYYSMNRERIASYTREKRKRNPYPHREWSLRWSRRNPDMRKIQSQRRRAALVAAGGDYTQVEWKELVEKYGHACLCCGRKEPEIKLTVDHVVPLSLGGNNTIGNIQPLCQQCNSGKKDKVIDYRGVRQA